MKRTFEIFLIILLFILILIIFLRLILPKEIDDVSPGIYCEQKYLEKADALWVIPNYKEKPISESKEWCNYILSLNKQIEMHGIDHYYGEFKENKISQEKLDYSIKIFEECFGYKPSNFKAPKLMLSKENQKMLRENNLKIKGKINQIIHKTYHCSDTGTFPNYIHDLL